MKKLYKDLQKNYKKTNKILIKNMRRVVGAAIIKDGEILLVRENQSWILPGGKPEPGESNVRCLRRELNEELSGTQLENIISYRRIQGRSPNVGDIVSAHVYFADIKGQLGQASGEIEEALFVRDTTEYNLSDLTIRIIEALKKDGYL